jgi:hypothetical protein
MPARTTMPKVVNCRKANTAAMITAENSEIDQTPVGIDDDARSKPIRRRNWPLPANASGAGLRDRIGAVIILDDFLQHDGEAEGHEDLVGMRALVEMLDQAAFHGEADQQP